MSNAMKEEFKNIVPKILYPLAGPFLKVNTNYEYMPRHEYTNTCNLKMGINPVILMK